MAICAVAEILMPRTAVLRLSDRGAHVTRFPEAGQTRQLLGHRVRVRQGLWLEAALRPIMGARAAIFGFPGRGRLTPGLTAKRLSSGCSRSIGYELEPGRELKPGTC